MSAESSRPNERAPDAAPPGSTHTLTVSQRAIETRIVGALSPERPTLVFLHEGLGCAELWRDFPDRVCELTGLAGVVSSRFGYGRSDPFDAPLEPDFMHVEARLALPALLDALGVRRAILVGHSDGASIALIHAAERDKRIEGVVAIAPHLFVEPVTIASIAELAARFPSSDLPARMARYHRDPVATFGRWADIWLDPRFTRWNVEDEVAKVACPVLALQGTRDEYGTMKQVHRVAELCPAARWVSIEGCAHSPHLERPATVAREIAAFVSGLGTQAGTRSFTAHHNTPTE